MVCLNTGALPVKTAKGFYQVIQYLRSLGEFDDKFTDLPDEIIIPGVKISIPSLPFSMEIVGDENNKALLKVIDRNPLYPVLKLTLNDADKPYTLPGEIKMEFVIHPFKDIKSIEEYPAQSFDCSDDYSLIRVNLENMSLTFLKYKDAESGIGGEQEEKKRKGCGKKDTKIFIKNAFVEINKGGVKHKKPRDEEQESETVETGRENEADEAEALEDLANGLDGDELIDLDGGEDSDDGGENESNNSSPEDDGSENDKE